MTVATQLTPQQSLAIDRYLDQVITLVEQLKHGVHLEPNKLQEQLKYRLGEVATLVPLNKQGRSILYAVTSWTDELLLTQPWSGREWWSDHVLEVDIFGTRCCSERFFKAAQAAAERMDLDTFRVYVTCVGLGFRGLYAVDTPLVSPVDYGLPSNLRSWLTRAHKRLQSVPDSANPPSIARTITGAEPLLRKHQVATWTTVVIALALANLTVVLLF